MRLSRQEEKNLILSSCTHIELDFESFQIKSNLDCYYTFPMDIVSNGIPVGAKYTEEGNNNNIQHNLLYHNQNLPFQSKVMMKKLLTKTKIGTLPRVASKLSKILITKFGSTN